MAIIPLVRTIVFALVPLFSLVDLGISVYLEYITDWTFVLPATLGFASAGVTIVTLPLFFILGHSRRGVFTSMIIFEIVWFLILWVAWVATAGGIAADRASFSGSCDDSNDPVLNQLCYEITVLEAFAFPNFFIVFFYYDVLVLYAIISAIRGRGIWTVSVRDAANGGSYNPAIAMMQPQYPQQVAPQYPQYPVFQNAAGYPSTVTQPYNAYPQQIIPPVGPGQPYHGTQQQYPGIPQGRYPGMPQQQQHPGAPQQQYPGALQ